MKLFAKSMAAWSCGRGFGAFGRREYQKAMDALETALGLDPKCGGFSVLTSLGRAYAAVGRHDEAVQTLEAARQDCARHPCEAMAALISVLNRLGESERAASERGNREND